MTEQAKKTDVAVAKPPVAYSPPVPLSELIPHGGSPALQIMLDDRLFDRARIMAGYLSKAEGFVPPNLVGKTESCFAVVMRAITWKLDPFAVAQSTYQTPGGKVGYEGKLCQAILENSGKLEGPVRYIHYGTVTLKMKNGQERKFKSYEEDAIDAALEQGAEEVSRTDWSAVQGKFEIKTSAKGREYAAATWTDKDAIGLGVLVRAQVHGEVEPREWPFDLIQAQPRNSTLWATDPKTQICYTAVRRFGSVAAPGLFMGVPFDREDMDYQGPENARNITPRPVREAYVAEETEKIEKKAATRRKKADKSETGTEGADTTEGDNPGAGDSEAADGQDKDDGETTTSFPFVNWDGEVTTCEDAQAFGAAMMDAIKVVPNKSTSDGMWDSNQDTINRLRAGGDDERQIAFDLGAALDERDQDFKEPPAKSEAKPADRLA